MTNIPSRAPRLGARPRRTVTLVACGVALVLGTALAPSADAAPGTDPAPAAAAAGVLSPNPAGSVDGRDPSGRIVGHADALSGVLVTPVGGDDVRRRLAEVQHRHDEAQSRVASTAASISAHTSNLLDAQADLRAASARVDAASTERESLAADYRAIVISRFVDNTDDLTGLDLSASLDSVVEHRRSTTISANVAGALRSRLSVVDRELRAARTAADDAQRRIDDQTTALRSDTAAHDGAAAVVAATAPEAERLRAAVVPGANDAQVAGTDMGLVALDAYWRAASSVAVTDPACHLSWWGLAEIGHTESHHGTFGGGRPGPDGTVSVKTIGIPLDGTHGTMVIADTDGGRLDDDPLFDRAVGPMQFIPGTWGRWGIDGNGDGIADPQNMYDAALAAAHYLCSTGDLGSDAGLEAAYLAYSHDAGYASRGLATAHGYGDAGLVLPATN